MCKCVNLPTLKFRQTGVKMWKSAYTEVCASAKAPSLKFYEGKASATRSRQTGVEIKGQLNN
jgi:hypothetical protein